MRVETWTWRAFPILKYTFSGYASLLLQLMSLVLNMKERKRVHELKFRAPCLESFLALLLHVSCIVFLSLVSDSRPQAYSLVQVVLDDDEWEGHVSWKDTHMLYLQILVLPHRHLVLLFLNNWSRVFMFLLYLYFIDFCFLETSGGGEKKLNPRQFDLLIERAKLATSSSWTGASVLFQVQGKKKEEKLKDWTEIEFSLSLKR